MLKTGTPLYRIHIQYTNNDSPETQEVSYPLEYLDLSFTIKFFNYLNISDIIAPLDELIDLSSSNGFKIHKVWFTCGEQEIYSTTKYNSIDIVRYFLRDLEDENGPTFVCAIRLVYISAEAEAIKNSYPTTWENK